MMDMRPWRETREDVWESSSQGTGVSGSSCSSSEMSSRSAQEEVEQVRKELAEKEGMLKKKREIEFRR